MHRRVRAGAGAAVLVVAACTVARAQGDVGVDHVILSTGDLARGSAEFVRRTGITPKVGGQHPGRGTQNSLVTLGGGRYLELLAPIAAKPDSATWPLRTGGWALHTKDLDGLLARMKRAGFTVEPPTPGSRLTPDSVLLKWRSASVEGPGLDGVPFFIEWGTNTRHPSTTSPAGCELKTLALAAPDTVRLHAFFAAAGYNAVLRTGPAVALDVTLKCPRGDVRFTR